MYIGFLFLNTKARCLLNSVPPAARCGDIFLNDNTEGANLGHRRVDPARPLHPAPSPYSGERGPAFQLDSGYMCTWLIKYSTSPLSPWDLPSYGKRVCMTAAATACVSPRNRVGGGVTVTRLLFILIPSSGSNNASLGREAGASSTGSPEAQVVALPSLRDVTKVPSVRCLATPTPRGPHLGSPGQAEVGCGC